MKTALQLLAPFRVGLARPLSRVRDSTDAFPRVTTATIFFAEYELATRSPCD